ncbi:MAG: single-stranded-DNA-specific exonuclease RecJ [Spirochaetaceae bacterium]|jgi:single-stranded-DNA-specific exonuclease|nr:single-stranded-DNA-specific exonuclease RecJ [Spirochaetaceae bacterium]
MKWEKKDISSEIVKELSSKYGCDALTASIFARRGIVQGEELRYFLETDLRHLRNPFELPDMEDAVDRILAAKEEGEKILIFGDRDADGVTSTALLAGFFASLDMDAAWRIPVGDEPYGLSIPAVEEFAAANGTLIITVDCGISNALEIARAKELNIDVIVTDHHNPPDPLPPALCIVNPKLADSAYPFKDLCGCGVAYKLVSALRFAIKSELYNTPICLLNITPGDGAYTVEIAKMRNLAVVKTLTETLTPGKITDTKLPAFLEGQHIFVWDGALQKQNIANLFGRGVDVEMLDLAPEIGKEIPAAAGKSLSQLREHSRIAKYSSEEASELSVFISLFISFMHRREQFFSQENLEDLQLAALGTLADIMPLRDENRIIVRQGLAGIMEHPRPGVADLLFKLGLAGRRIGGMDISWQVCPAINAPGRMGKPDKAVSLFLESDAETRDKLADELMAMNEERKKLGVEAWKIIEPSAEKSLQNFDGKLALAYGTEIYRGVTGLMANRMLAYFKVPSIVVSFGETVLTGSVRSVKGYDLRSLMESCSDLFIDWGGHNYAAGFSLEKSRWDDFLERLKTAGKNIEFSETPEEETAVIDAELPLSYLTPDIFKVIDAFEPYGEGNEALTFMSRNITITDIMFMGKSEAKHIKLTLDAGKHKWPGVYWRAADKVKKDFDINDKVDAAFKITRNWFNGAETPQLIITDIKRS